MPEITASRYELLYIIPTTMTDEEVGSVEGLVGSLIAKYEGKVESTSRLGKFRLAYPIKKQHHGHYVLVHFSADHPQVAKIEENLRITPEVLRHIIVRADETTPKFEMVQFQEVNLDAKEDKPRRRRVESKPGEAASTEAPKKEGETSETLTSEDVDKKIESALSEDGQDV